MPIKYLVLEDTDEVITLVEDKNKVEQIQEEEEEEEEEDEDEKENNNQGVQLNSEKLIVIRWDTQSASAGHVQAYVKALENTFANPRQTVTVTSQLYKVALLSSADHWSLVPARHNF